MGELHNSSQSLLAGNLSVAENCEIALQMYTAQWERLNSPHYHANHTTGYNGLPSENVVCLAVRKVTHCHIHIKECDTSNNNNKLNSTPYSN